MNVINTDYELELDFDEQEELINRYVANKNIPEWLALKVFMYICDHQWEDKHIILYFSGPTRRITTAE